MAIKTKSIYVCQKCKTEHMKWAGICSVCSAWNTLDKAFVKNNSRFSEHYDSLNNKIYPLANISLPTNSRLPTSINELDRVLGGGLIVGSSVLVGGNPGIGKSTLLLQALCNLGKNHNVLYVTGEESVQQIALRTRRLQLPEDKLLLLAETQIETIINMATKKSLDILAIDSIQTMYTETVTSAPGGINQIRECTAHLLQYAKHSKIALLIVGHVTKDGNIAGPKILEHMVDCVLYFEGEYNDRYRIIRATKNRFGAINELGIFAMTTHGLREVSNPSSIFLANKGTQIPGSSIMVTWEGSRPLLVEVQALVDSCYLTYPRRVAVGIDQNRLTLLLAVLHKHCKVPIQTKDVFINIVGGIKITETAIDLALLLAILSSINNRPLDEGLVAFGEVGLAGEIRPVPNGQERIKAIVKHGYKKAIIPYANTPRNTIPNIEIVPVKYLNEAFNAIT